MSAKFRVPPEMMAGCQHHGRLRFPGEVFTWKPRKGKDGKPIPGDNPSPLLEAVNDEAYELQMAVWKAKVKEIKEKNKLLVSSGKADRVMALPAEPVEPKPEPKAEPDEEERPSLEKDLTDAGVDVTRASDSM